LAKIEGIVEIETDVANRICTFKVEKSNAEYETTLAEFAKTNPHLAGYEIQ
jgi:hypothetical protein